MQIQPVFICRQDLPSGRCYPPPLQRICFWRGQRPNITLNQSTNGRRQLLKDLQKTPITHESVFFLLLTPGEKLSKVFKHVYLRNSKPYLLSDDQS